MTTLMQRFNDAQSELMRMGKVIALQRKENEEMKWKIKSLECDKFGMHLDIKKRWEMQEKLTSSIKFFQKENEELKELLKEKEKKTDWEVKYAELYERYMIEKYARKEKIEPK